MQLHEILREASHNGKRKISALKKAELIHKYYDLSQG